MPAPAQKESDQPVTRVDMPPEAVPKPSTGELFATFLRIGVTAFGGAAMIAFIRKRVVAEKKWISPDSFQSGVALCQAIPGATVMQMAGYIGLQLQGVRGAVASFVGFGLPAFLLMLALSVIYSQTHELPTFVAIFSGLQAVIVGVIANAAITFGKASLKGWRDCVIAVVAAGLFGLRINPLFIIAASALLGWALNHGLPQKTPPSKPSNSTLRPLGILLVLSAVFLGALLYLRPDLFRLSMLMSKIDLLAFGGAFGSVPLMFHEVVEALQLMDGPTFLNGIVLGQFTPGPIVITATFVGYLLYGLSGAVVASLGIFTPSFLILVGVAPWFDRLSAMSWFNRSIRGILCSFVGLLFTVTLQFAWNVSWGWPHIAIAIGTLAALFYKVDLLWVVLVGGTISAFVL
jgi:chromate transporter